MDAVYRTVVGLTQAMLRLSLATGFGVGFGVGRGVGLGVGRGVGLGVGRGVGLGVGFGVCWAVTGGVDEADGTGEGVGLGEGVGVALGVGDGVGRRVGVGLGERVGTAVGSGVSRIASATGSGEVAIPPRIPGAMAMAASKVRLPTSRTAAESRHSRVRRESTVSRGAPAVVTAPGARVTAPVATATTAGGGGSTASLSSPVAAACGSSDAAAPASNAARVGQSEISGRSTRPSRYAISSWDIGATSIGSTATFAAVRRRWRRSARSVPAAIKARTTRMTMRIGCIGPRSTGRRYRRARC